MKIFYIPKTFFGEFFYNPESREGVYMRNDKPVLVRMSKDFNPHIYPDCKECEVDESVFSQLKGVVLREGSTARDLERILENFPRVHNSPDLEIAVPVADPLRGDNP